MSQCSLTFISVISYTYKEAVGKRLSVSENLLKTSRERKFETGESSQSTALLSKLGDEVAQ